MIDKVVKIKWAGPNSPVIMLHKGNRAVHMSKRELFALVVEAKEFIEYYEDNFADDAIDNEDAADGSI